jgi:hypothetical protein
MKLGMSSQVFIARLRFDKDFNYLMKKYEQQQQQ